ncbi:CopD family protein [Nitrosomonas sp. Nm132]|jgi:uncharacterized membrane protein|uniref:CopD family protein n=1 Tax=Nitrosomonas sp. Nm132 TaxID=1881053 RepID=UPI00088F13E6|nr:CopD family protein [Nitrosomonas sp. Nm132]SDG91060.1 Uncharacterized membrane protein [Nitrosomonas sp. Nm132]
MKIPLFLHLLGVIVWVGGMFFAYWVLRPIAAQLLEPPIRLKLWSGVFSRFFPWVFLSAGFILASGLYMVMQMGGFAAVDLYIHFMFALGLLMMLIFIYVFFSAFKKLNYHVAREEWPSAGTALGQIRLLIGLNLILGVVTITVAVLGGSA